MAGKKAISRKGVLFRAEKPRKFLVKKVGYNSKYASRVYLPIEWEGKEVLVILNE